MTEHKYIPVDECKRGYQYEALGHRGYTVTKNEEGDDVES